MKENNKRNKIIKFILIALGIVLVGVGIGYGIYKIQDNMYEKNNTKEKIDNDSIKTPEDFIEYLNEKDFKNEDVIYKDLKISFEAKKNDLGYKYTLSYKDKVISDNSLDEYEYLNSGKYYLLNDDENYAFVLVSEIGPVGTDSIYLIEVVDIKGNVLLSEKIITNTYEVGDNILGYSFETKMSESLELDIIAENGGNFCDYLNNNYEDDYVVSGSKKYEYKNGKLNLIEDNKKTIKDYKEKSNCGTVIINEDTSKLVKSNLTSCTNQVCTEVIKSIKITYDNGKDFGEGIIKINNNIVLREIMELSSVYVLDEVVIVVTAGTDIRSTIIHVFDKNANEIKTIYSLDDKYDDMVISSYQITEDGIKMSGDRMTHGPAFASDYDEVLDSCSELKKLENEVVSGEYEIDYLGNGKFSEIKNIKYNLLKDDLESYIEDVCKNEN